MRNLFLLTTVTFGFISFSAEKLVFDYKKTFSRLPEKFQSQSVFCTQSPAFLLDNTAETKQNVSSRSFYVFYKKSVPQFLGKTLIAKMKVRRLKGQDPLTLSFRILGTKKPVGGNNLRVDFPADGRWHDVEISCTIPAKESAVNPIHNCNLQILVYAAGTEKTAWAVDELKVFEGKAQKLTAVPGESLGIAQIRNAKEVLTLIRNKKLLFDIVVDSFPNELAEYAAQELQEHIFKATGSKPEILRGKKKKKAGIWIGDTVLARKYGVDPKMFAPDNWSVVRVGNDIIISGGDSKNIRRRTILSRTIAPMGTLFATYEFLERFFNIRWFWPGKLGTVIPETKNLSFKKLFISGSPSYAARTHFYEHSLEKDLPPEVIYRWHRRIRSGGEDYAPIANHSFRDWGKKYAHKPEIFALQFNGKRKNNSQEGVHLCLTNPETVKLAAEDVISAFKKMPYLKFRPVMPGDSNILHACKCKNCTAHYQPEKGPQGIHTNLTWEFVNKVARLVAKACPGKYIKCASYGSHYLPPDFPLESNVAVTLCLDPVPQGSLRCKTMWQQQIQAWKKTGAKLYVWEYWDCTRIKKGTHGAPAIYARQLKELYMLDRGTVRGRAIELAHYKHNGDHIHAWGDWILDMPAVYIAGKLMWDLSTDVEDELERYYRDFFGPAEKEIREFYDLMENAWMHSVWKTGDQITDNHVSVWQHTYPGEFIDKIMAILRQAEKKCRGKEPYASRMAKMLEFYKYVEENSRRFRKTTDISQNKNQILRLRKSTAPVLDGKINTSEWKNSVQVHCAVHPLGIKKIRSRTNIYLKQDGENLYVGAETFPSAPGQIQKFPAASLGKRDAFLWTFESVELLFANQEKERKQLIIAPENMLFDAFWKKNIKRFDFSKGCVWDPPVKLVTSSSGPRWQMECAIPLKELDFYISGGKKSLRVNFIRNHVFKNKPQDKRFIQETAFWLLPNGGSENTESYGTLILE